MFKEKIGCPECGSSKTPALAVYENDGKISGWCFACDKYFADPYKGVVGTKKNLQRPKAPIHKDISFVPYVSSILDLPHRGLKKDVLSRYNVTSSVNESTGEVEVTYFPYYENDQIKWYKVKTPDKKIHSIGDAKKPSFFGQQLVKAGGRLLIITEGEEDAIAAATMLLKRNKRYNVVSLPSGANTRVFKDNYEWLESFETLMLDFDKDEPGQKLVQEVTEMFDPGKVKTVQYDEKDANDMLRAGKGGQYFSAIMNAQSIRPDGIVDVDDIWDEAIKPVEKGFSWPWPTITKLTYGIRRKELYGFGAGSGCGKTEGMKELINHLINEHNLPVGLIFLEETPPHTLKALAGKRANKRFHVPDGSWTTQELIQELGDLRGKVWFYNHWGGKDWEAIKAKIKYMSLGLGIKDIFLDHLTALVAQEDNEYTALNRIMEEMASLVQQTDTTIYYVSHLSTPQGTPHEEGGRVTARQFKGSGAIRFWSNYLFGYERNQQAEDEQERNTTTFRVLKDRNTGLATGHTIKLFYDHSTGRMQEVVDPFIENYEVDTESF